MPGWATTKKFLNHRLFQYNGPFTPHDTESETDKICTEPIAICILLSLVQCEHAIREMYVYVHRVVLTVSKNKFFYHSSNISFTISMNRNAFEELEMPRQQNFRFRRRYVMCVESKLCPFCSCDIWLLMFKIRRGISYRKHRSLQCRTATFLKTKLTKINCAVKMHNKFLKKFDLLLKLGSINL